MEIDTAWKRLFALPAMVEHLLRAVAPELARRLDFTAMEQLAANWARPAGGADPRPGAQRYADAVWRIRYAGDGGHTLVLLLEFQSTVDPDMAARTLAYTGLLREHLRRQDRLDPDGGCARWPWWSTPVRSRGRRPVPPVPYRSRPTARRC